MASTLKNTEPISKKLKTRVIHSNPQIKELPWAKDWSNYLNDFWDSVGWQYYLVCHACDGLCYSHESPTIVTTTWTTYKTPPYVVTDPPRGFRHGILGYLYHCSVGYPGQNVNNWSGSLE